MIGTLTAIAIFCLSASVMLICHMLTVARRRTDQLSDRVDDMSKTLIKFAEDMIEIYNTKTKDKYTK
jgi:hypothetical protein